MEAVGLYETVESERSVPEEKKVPVGNNFTFFGNPGTGKTTVARLYGKIMHALGVRSATLVETTGEELLREGGDFAKGLIAQAMGGVLFIDEAHALDPGASKEGKGIVGQILTVAENKRTEISIILAGYKEDIEDKLYAADPGLSSRFKAIEFEDFCFEELRAILIGLVKKHHWGIKDARVVDVAARRIARGRGVKGFANARSVRETFEAAYQAALSRQGLQKEFEFWTEDFLGPPPSPAHRPQLAAALAELEARTGLGEIKAAVGRLVQLAVTF